MRSEVLTAANVKAVVSWNAASYDVVDTHQISEGPNVCVIRC